MRKQERMPKQKKSKNVAIFCIVVAILSCIALVNARLSRAGGNMIRLREAELQIHVIDVGQGDSILVIADEHAMLIDAGESDAGSTITDYLEEQGITELDYAVATHMHADHIGGFPAVFDAVRVRNVLEPALPEAMIPTSVSYEKYLEAVGRSGAKLAVAEQGDVYTLGNATVTVLAPLTTEAEEHNNLSLVLRVAYDDTVCLLTGDMEEAEEKTLLDAGTELKADFLKAGHHGSSSSSSEAFLEAVQPSCAAISCGKDNAYGHPHDAAMERLRKWTNRIYTTDKKGTILFLYDKDTDKYRFTTAREVS